MTLADILANPADALSARYDRAVAAYERLTTDTDPTSDKWAMTTREGVTKLFVEATDGVHAWMTDGQTCDCPDATEGIGARFLKGTCKHICLYWILAHQRATRDAKPAHDSATALLAVPMSADPLFAAPAPRKTRPTLTFDQMFPASA